ncbi:MAG: PilZ domain-containing protein [Acidobacteriota bacterium]|nr:PilZ domain-containing protein [Acidobacteriota bacterium]MDH3522884.1 PilZ domain-containing protein [Acidobacteriota bacterium]
MAPQETILAVGGEIVEVVAPLLEHSPYKVARVPDGRTAVLLAHNMRYQHLVVSFPLPDLTIGELAERLRQPGSASPTARLLLITTHEHLAEAVEHRDEGLIAGAVAVDDDPERLVEAVTGFMKTAPRVSAALPVTVRATDGAWEAVDGETVNLSESGILVRCVGGPPCGREARVELRPSRAREPIIATAVVVRRARPEREGITGLGLMFVGFQDDGQARLAVHIRGILAELVG